MPALTAQLNYSTSLLPGPVQVFTFDGTVTTGLNPFTNIPAGGFTISCWIQTQQTDPGAVLMSYSVTNPSGTPRLFIKGPDNITIGWGTNSVTTNISIADNYWHYLAITIAPSDATHFMIRMYKDGMPVFSGSGALSRTAGQGFVAGGALALGLGSVTGEINFQGNMSEFRWYTGVLTDDEVLSGMQVRGYGPPLIQWSMDTAANSGTIAGTPVFSPSTLFYLTLQLLASWSGGTAASYTLQLTDTTNGTVQVVTNLTGSSMAVLIFQVNHGYSAIVQPAGGVWSTPATARALNLQQVLPTVTPALNGPVLNCPASWAATDQADGYQVALYQNGSQSPASAPVIVSSPGYDLSASLSSEDSWQFIFQTATQNALGPSNPVRPSIPAVPAVSDFIYQNDATAPFFQLNWNAGQQVQNYYVQVYKTISGTDTLVFQSLPAGQSSSLTIPASQFAYTAGDIIKARIRSLSAGTIGAWTLKQQVTVHSFDGPTNLVVTANLSQNTITLNWQFTTGVNPGFRARLWKGTGTPSYTYVTVASGTTCVFTNVTMANQDQFFAQVQAVQDNSYGLWCQSQNVIVGLTCSLSIANLYPTTNGSGKVTAVWTNPGCVTNTVFDLVICHASSGCPDYGSTGSVCQLAGSNLARENGVQTSFSIDWNNTQFKDDPDTTVYCVQVRAKQNDFTGDWKKGNITFTKNQITTIPPGTGLNFPTGGDPVDLSSGSYSYSATDIEVPALLPLSFMTFYNTFTPIASENPVYTGTPMGNRWNHSYNTRILTDPANLKLVVLWGQGSITGYSIPSSITGNYFPSGIPNGDQLYFGPYDQGTNNQYVLTTKDQTNYVFNTNGQLTEIISPQGAKTTLQYDGQNRLQTITDTQFGGTLTLQYDGNNRINQVTDQTNRKVIYTYFPNGDLQNRTDPNGKLRSFTYSDNILSLMQTASDQNGNTVNTFIKNTYDSANRVHFQQDARAVASGASYGFTFDYAESVENGVTMITATVTDRMSNTSVLKSIKANGNLVTATYNLPNNVIRQITNTYDGMNNLATQTVYEGQAAQAGNFLANCATYTYDGNRNLLSLSYPAPLGQVAAFTYNAQNQPLTFTDAIGNTTSYGYYPDGALHTITNALGQTKELTYYQSPAILKGMPYTLKDEAGNLTTYTYINNDPRNKKVVFADGSSNLCTLDALFRLKVIQYADPASNVLKTITRTYDNLGQVLTQSIQFAGQSVASAYQTVTTYNDVGLPATLTDPLQEVTQFFYNPNNFLSQVIYPSPAGQTLTTLFGYDQNDNPNKNTYAPGIFEQFTYDATGRMTSYTDGKGNNWLYTYGMLLTNPGPYPSASGVVYPLYDPNTPTLYNTIQVRDCLGRVTGLTNPSGQLISVSYGILPDPLPNTYRQQVTYTLPPVTPGSAQYTVVEIYDALGRLVSYQDQKGKITTTQYTFQPDPVKPRVFNSLVTSTDPLSNQYAILYNPAGLPLNYSATNPDGSTASLSTYLYDTLGRILQTTEQKATGIQIVTSCSYVYNQATNLLDVNVGLPGSTSNPTILSFNGKNQQVSEKDALGNVLLRTYTPAGLLNTITNARNELISFGYDAAQRYNSLTLPGNVVILQDLDNNGNSQGTTVNGTSMISRTFDNLNRLSTRTSVPSAQTVGYQYTPMNQVAQLTYPDQKAVSYLYDGRSQLHQVTDWNNRQTIYQYYPDGTLQSAALPNGTNAAYIFDDAGRLTGLSNKNGQAIISSIAYSKIDALGNRRQMDAILPIAPGQTALQNSTRYNPANELTQFNSLALGFDTDGNTTSLPGNSNILAYNALNQLTGFGADSYTYDPDGLRTQCTIQGQTTGYIQDINGYTSPLLSEASFSMSISGTALSGFPNGGRSPVPLSRQSLQSPIVLSNTFYPSSTQEYTGFTNLLTAANAGYRPLSTILRLNLPPDNGKDQNRILQTSQSGSTALSFVYGQGLISSEDSNGNLHVYHFDARGSTLALTNSQGILTDTYGYDPYGNLNAQNGTTANPFLYSGRDGVLSDANGLYYMRARYYNPVIQRFINRDFVFGSMLYSQTLNRYAYVTGNPISFTDPQGLGSQDGGGSSYNPWKWIAITAGSIVGGTLLIGGIVQGALYLGLLGGGAAAAGGAGAGVAGAAGAVAGAGGAAGAAGNVAGGAIAVANGGGAGGLGAGAGAAAAAAAEEIEMTVMGAEASVVNSEFAPLLEQGASRVMPNGTILIHRVPFAFKVPNL